MEEKKKNFDPSKVDVDEIEKNKHLYREDLK